MTRKHFWIGVAVVWLLMVWSSWVWGLGTLPFLIYFGVQRQPPRAGS